MIVRYINVHLIIIIIIIIIIQHSDYHTHVHIIITLYTETHIAIKNSIPVGVIKPKHNYETNNIYIMTNSNTQ